jgi:hypothetical protein
MKPKGRIADKNTIPALEKQSENRPLERLEKLPDAILISMDEFDKEGLHYRIDELQKEIEAARALIDLLLKNKGEWWSIWPKSVQEERWVDLLAKSISSNLQFHFSELVDDLLTIMNPVNDENQVYTPTRKQLERALERTQNEN